MSPFSRKLTLVFVGIVYNFFYSKEDNFFLIFMNSFTYLSLFIVFPPRRPLHYNYFPFPPPPPHFCCFASSPPLPHFYYFPPPTPHLYCFSSTTTTATFLLFLPHHHHHHHHISIIFLHHHHTSLFSPKNTTPFQFFLPPLPV